MFDVQIILLLQVAGCSYFNEQIKKAEKAQKQTDHTKRELGEAIQDANGISKSVFLCVKKCFDVIFLCFSIVCDVFFFCRTSRPAPRAAG